ncbi:MAG TPA: response regulator [Pyrinomonadaceae bacterium]|jgi:DNA-binding LytR/AlgR family response regulator|nr:response regulator [Pyrinomonadaceae bacterium]
MRKIRVLIVDDEPLAREGIRIHLQGETGIEIIGECSNGMDAVEAIGRQSPDLVFLDVKMPLLDGFGVVEAVGVERMPVVIFVTAFDEYALPAFEAMRSIICSNPLTASDCASLSNARGHRFNTSRPTITVSICWRCSMI